MTNRILPSYISRDVLFGGDGHIAGTTKVDASPDIPVSRRVRLFEARTAQLLRETWSANDGTYSIGNVARSAQQRYFVTSHDHTLTYNAVIADRIAAEAMPAQTPSGILLSPGSLFDISGATLLHMHMDGDNNSLSFPDVKGRTITSNSSLVKVSTAQSKFGGASAYFPGTSGAYLSAATDTSSAFGSNDFTVDFWVYQVARSVSAANIFDTLPISGNGSRPNSFTIYIDASGYLRSFHSSVDRLVSTVAIPLQKWTHCAMTRKGNTLSFWINGILRGAGSYNISDTLGGMVFGAASDAPSNTNYTLNGYLDEFRVVRGKCLYDGNFVPPSAPYADTGIFEPVGVAPASLNAWTDMLLHFDNDLVDSAKGVEITAAGNAAVSSAQSKFGGYSLALDGTGDWLSLVAPQAIAAQNFTLECWIRIATIASGMMIIDTRDSEASATGVAFHVTTAGKLAVKTNNVVTAGTTTLQADTWYHVALVRSLGTLRGYLEGAQEFSVANTASLSTTAWRVGHNFNAAGSYSAGHIDELRATVGAGRYASAFTPAGPFAG